MQERKRRNRLAKLARLHQLLTDRPGDREIHCLRRKLHLDATDASTSDLFLQVQQEVGRLRTQICQEDQETKRVAIQKWRQDMRHNLTARYKWIRRGQECPHLPTLASNGETFLGDEKSIAAITNHWRSTWNAARHRAQLSLPQQLNGAGASSTTAPRLCGHAPYNGGPDQGGQTPAWCSRTGSVDLFGNPCFTPKLP